MVFLQPVVVNDAQAANQTPAAEVRVIDRRALEQPAWPAPMLAQAGMDQRSPFGNNAPTSNELTPKPTPANPAGNSQSGFGNPGAGAGQVADPGSTTKIPPAQGKPDAGPPPPSAGSTTTPGTEPSTAPTQIPNPNATMPNTQPGDPNSGTTLGGGAGATPPTVPDSRSVPPVSSPQPVETRSSSTFPGASSGASNSR
jgi:hypothetical protein